MIYKGWTIRPTTEPWARKFNMNYEYFRGDVPDENVRTAETVKEAQDQIDELNELYPLTNE